VGNINHQHTTSPEESAAALQKLLDLETAKRRAGESSNMKDEMAKMHKELEETKERLRKSDAARRRLHDEVQSLKGNIRVFARVRPAMQKPAGPSEISVSVDGMSLTLDVAGDQLRRASDKAESHIFAFNQVFAPEATQLHVFEEVNQLIQSALDGYNVCLFSYGQTGSGKTYTMMGDQTSPTHRGIVPRSVDQVLCTAADLRQDGWEYVIEASYVEIYNEQVRDLLAVDFAKEKLAKHEIVHANGDVYAKGVRKVAVSDADQVHGLLQLAGRNRAVGHTDKNHESARSHSVFTLHLVGRNTRVGGGGAKTGELVGSLSLCDLAGSERLQTSHAQDERLKETQAINTSLSALSTVFTALSQKQAHVPFRNSALTHLLSPCLSGEGKTLMIVNLSADHCDASETLCSLRFAQTVNKTETGRAKKNVREVAPQQRGRVNSMPQ
jgi:kinesin family protein C1